MLAVTTVLSPTETIDPLLAITMWVPLAMIEPVALMETLPSPATPCSWTGLEADGAEDAPPPTYDTPDTRGWVNATDRVGAPNEYPTASDLRIRIGDAHATERPGERVDEMNICLGLPASTVARPA